MKKLVILVIALLVRSTLQDISNNEVDESLDPLLSVVQNVIKNQELGDLGGLLGNFISSEGGKHIGEMFLGANNGGAASDIVRGIGNMLQEGGSSGLDLSVVSKVLGVLSSNSFKEQYKPPDTIEGFDFSNVAALASSFANQEGAKDMLGYLPTFLNLFSSLYGPDAEKTAQAHAGHSWLLPPVIERAHIFFDQLMNSDIGRDMAKWFGAEKYVKLFKDENGFFSMKKMIDLLENHSFRKYWIRTFTDSISHQVAYVADPAVQTRYLQTSQFFINNFLKTQGCPRSVHFDVNKPTESLSSIISYFTRKYLNIKWYPRPYVQPITDFFHELFLKARSTGIVGRSITSEEITHKMADTINLEIIEPVARISRALRFALKTPVCAKYVTCVANQIESPEKLTFPGVRKTISSWASMPACWYLSGNVNLPFWSLYTASSDEDCKKYYHDSCNDFHLEELKVTEEYVHTEL